MGDEKSRGHIISKHNVDTTLSVDTGGRILREKCMFISGNVSYDDEIFRGNCARRLDSHDYVHFLCVAYCSLYREEADDAV